MPPSNGLIQLASTAVWHLGQERAHHLPLRHQAAAGAPIEQEHVGLVAEGQVAPLCLLHRGGACGRVRAGRNRDLPHAHALAPVASCGAQPPAQPRADLAIYRAQARRTALHLLHNTNGMACADS